MKLKQHVTGSGIRYPGMGKCFENKKPAVEGLCRAEKSKPSAVWFVLLFGSSPWNELSTELEVCFGGTEMVCLNAGPWSEVTFMQRGKRELKPGDNSQAKLLDSIDVASAITEIWRIA